MASKKMLAVNLAIKAGGYKQEINSINQKTGGNLLWKPL